MSKRYFKPQSEAPVIIPSGISTLPTNSPIAVYYRQSTDAQIGNISTTLQTVDMVAYLKQRGWAENDIFMIDMDGGVSGTTKIDERPGMKLLFGLITEKKIQAIACQDEDRLFRDVTQIQVNIFIEACRAANVIVITPSMVYDFANELTGTFHARQFRFKSEMAAEYINSVIRGKLHRAKEHLWKEGCWAGASMPVGFMVDTRKFLPDGSINSQRRRYAAFEPYATVVRDYFDLFLSYAGNLRATITHIHSHGPYFPDPKLCPPPEGFKVVYQLHHNGRGFCPSRGGIKGILTNVAYIGHWQQKSVVVRRDNHPAIIKTDVFMKAFNYLSALTLEGQTNPHYQPFHDHARPSKDQKRPIERPLCSGLIFCLYDNQWKNVNVLWQNEHQYYDYSASTNIPGKETLWRKKSSDIDNAVVSLLREKIEATFGSDMWEQTIAEFNQHFEEETKRTQSQLSTLERVMQNHVVSLDSLTNPEMVKAVQARYADAQTEHQRLTATLAELDNELKRHKTIRQLRELCRPTFDDWGNFTIDEKRVVLQTFIHRIEAESIPGGGMQIAIRWQDNTYDAVIVPQLGRRGEQWLQAENETLLTLVDRNATQVEIAAAFPDKKWRAIRNRYSYLRKKESLQFPVKPIRDYETYNEYMKYSQGSSPTPPFSGKSWSQEDETRLIDMVRKLSSWEALASVFASRSLDGIRIKINRLRKAGIDMPTPGQLRWENEPTHWRKVEKENILDCTPKDVTFDELSGYCAVHFMVCRGASR